MSSSTIYGHMQGAWMKGSTQRGLSPKWINEEPVYVFRDRSLALPERGSPAALTLEGNSLVTGFILGVVASYVTDYLYDKSKRRKR